MALSSSRTWVTLESNRMYLAVGHLTAQRPRPVHFQSGSLCVRWNICNAYLGQLSCHLAEPTLPTAEPIDLKSWSIGNKIKNGKTKKKIQKIQKTLRVIVAKMTTSTTAASYSTKSRRRVLHPKCEPSSINGVCQIGN